MSDKKLQYSKDKPDENSSLTPEEQGFFRTPLGWRKMEEVDPVTECVRGNSKYDHTMPDRLRQFFDVPYTYIEELIGQKKVGKEMVDYVASRRLVANPLPTFEGFCRMIKVSSVNVRKWREMFPEFDEAYQEAKDIQFDMWVHNTNAGYYNTAFSIYYGKAVMKLFDRPDSTIVKSINYNTGDNFEDMSDEELEKLAKKFKII